MPPSLEQMPFDAYRQLRGINWSQLKHLRQSAMHYQHHRHVASEDTPALALGRLVHALVFEPHTAGADFAIWEGEARRGKEWEAFKVANADRTILKLAEYSEAEAMAAAVRNHPLVAPYIDQMGLFEATLQWTDGATGIPCKARLDWLLRESRTLIDLKTAVDIEGAKFGRQAAQLGYHCQLAHYAAGIEAVLGWRPEKVAIVAVEKTAPHDVAVFVLDDETRHLAETEVSELLARLRAHVESGQWPGRYAEERALQLPAWMFESEEDDTDPAGFGVTVGE